MSIYVIVAISLFSDSDKSNQYGNFHKIVTIKRADTPRGAKLADVEQDV